MTRHLEEVDQARANALKVIRAAVRLKHSIQADNELNDVLPRAEAHFNALVQKGKLPLPADIKRSLGL